MISGASLPTGREWWGCASRVTVCGRAEFHPVSARVLAMATASGTGICANFSREVSSLGWFGARVLVGFLLVERFQIYLCLMLPGVLGECFSSQCGRSAAIAVSGGSSSYRRTSFLSIQRISGFRAAASITGPASGFNLSRTLRVAGGPEAGFIDVKCEAASSEKGAELEQTENQTEVIREC